MERRSFFRTLLGLAAVPFVSKPVAPKTSAITHGRTPQIIEASHKRNGQVFAVRFTVTV
jgi:hypothetical protein